MINNIPDDFNTEIYRLLNSDLHNFNEDELIKHYINYGYNEGRKYKYNIPDDFIPEIYRLLNSDLNNFNEDELIKHYINHGFNENRIYKINHRENDDKLFSELINKYTNESIKNYTGYNYDCINIFTQKIFSFYDYNFILNYLLENNFTEHEIINIILHENYLKIKNVRLEIDKIVLNFINNKKLEENIYFKNISIKNVDFNKKYYFGIVIPVYNRYYITKIFLECLKKNINFDSIIFCIVDDGSDNNVLTELENLNLNVIIVYANRNYNKNIYSSHNTNVPGSLYPLTLYIGHEILKNYCQILGVLDSDSFINENYFNECKSFIDILDIDNVIFSGFNSYSICHQFFDRKNINNKNVLYKNMVGGISQFYSVGLYEQFKFKFTGEESYNFWAYDYDFQISEFMKNTNRYYVCLEESNIQHIGISSCMIRNNNITDNNNKELIEIIYKLLIDPNYIDSLNIQFDFDRNFIRNIENINEIFNKIWFYSVIDKIYYINLDERLDRKQSIEDQLNKYNIYNYERFSAIKPSYNTKYNEEFIDNEIEKLLNGYSIVDDLFNNYSSSYILDFSKDYVRDKPKDLRRRYLLGALGCKLSYLEIFKKSENNNILILEDDAILHDKFDKHIKILYNNLKNIDFDYNIIWLSPNWLFKNDYGIVNRGNSYKYINDNFAKVDSSKYYDGHNGSTLNNAGNIYNKNIIKYINENSKDNKSEIDMWFRDNIQSLDKTYTTIPNLISQKINYSNIENYETNYTEHIQYHTRNKFNIFTILYNDDTDKRYIYLNNLKNNLQKMIGYEKIYYISNEKLFDIDILHYIDINSLNCDLSNIKENFPNLVNDNNIKYFYYMDINERFENNYYPFDENNYLVNPNNIYYKF
jgi:GR25 family glycosyltransferase involved in LPS biosynthesis